MESLSCPCRAYGCSFCHQFLSDVGLSVIPSMCSGILVASVSVLCFSQFRNSWVAVCQEMAVNYLFAKHDQQTEWQCQGAPVRSSVCRMSRGVQWTLTDSEHASVKEQIAHTPLRRVSTIVC